ncbi:MAG: hypothetical protein ABEJ59_02325 [Halanaeroarchaeum sp.]
MDRIAAVDRLETIVEIVATESLPVDVTEVWVYGDLALGHDPVERLDVFFSTDAGADATHEALADRFLPGPVPTHLELCNLGFEESVRRRVDQATATGTFGMLLDPRAAAVWIDGVRDDEAVEKLRGGELAFPTLPEAFAMLGMDEKTAETAADVVAAERVESAGHSVHSNVR